MNKELNGQVAVEVMGWHFSEDWNCLIPPEQKAKPSEMWSGWKEGVDEDGFNYEYREPVKGAVVPGVTYNGDFTEVLLPDYSGDMGEAWKVVEKVVDDWNCIFGVSKISDRYQMGSGLKYTLKYTAKISGGDLVFDDPNLVLTSYADSAAKAVCLTALRVIRGSKNDS